jgi:putative ABC transport system ATP-binding protein
MTSSSDSTLISLDKVSLTLPSLSGNVDILKQVSLDVRQKEVLALVGPSGSGKTSLIMLMAGLEKPTDGKITMLGTTISSASEDALARFRRHHIGIVFQSFHLIPTMTALENVAVPLEFSGEKDAFARAEDALVQVGLGHRLTHYPSQLSGGEQQRVAIARAFVMKPSLLLADEPTGNLDQTTGNHIIELLFSLREKHGTTLVLITHDGQLASRCDRSVRMMNGQIIS